MTFVNRAKRGFIVMLILTLTTACFSSDEPVPTATPPAANNATEQPAAAIANTTDSTIIEGNSREELDNVRIIEEITTIERYRMRITLVNEISNRNANVHIDAAYVKEPPAEEITMQVDENGEMQTVTMLLVDGLRYMRSGDMVVQTADARMNLRELTLIQPRDATVLGNRFQALGEETVNERATTHYQGGPDAVPTGGTAGDTFDVTALESASIDLWVDQAENFIVAMEVKVEGFDEDQNARMRMRFDYFDFNNPDIVITAPADAMSVPGGVPNDTDGQTGGAGSSADAETGGSEPRNALGKLLGFDMLLATGSEITLASGQIVQISSIYTVDEAVNLVQTQLPANGYTLLSSIAPQAGESVLMFQKAAQIATIQIATSDRGSDWNIVIAP
ncbi:MAG: hypothetical protein R2932_15240 [Caldilineaceae bacterium]